MRSSTKKGPAGNGPPAAGVVETRRLPLGSVHISTDTQTRASMRPDVIDDYAARLRADEAFDFPPADVFQDGDVFWLADGFHRHGAYRSAERPDIPVTVHQGDMEDALLFAAGANAEHGVQRTREDKRRCVSLLLNSPKWGNRTAAWIAEKANVSDHLVSEVRAEREAATVSNSRNTPTPSHRIGRDGRKYNARKPKKIARTAAARTNGHATKPIPEPEFAPPPAADPHGLPVRDNLKDVFAALPAFDQLREALKAAEKAVHEIATSPGGTWFAKTLRHTVRRPGDKATVRYRSKDLEQLLADLDGYAPYVGVCPHCELAHPGNTDPQCNACKGLGWGPKTLYTGASEEAQAAADALKVEGVA
jgi:hypothetical protein